MRGGGEPTATMSVTEGFSVASERKDTYQVVIAGGGPTGLAAGLFTARYGLSTLILDRGKSSLRQCAYIENYLGFPGGIEVSQFLGLATAHAEDAGCRIEREQVSRLDDASQCRETEQRPDEDGRGEGDGTARPRFMITTRHGARFYADRFIAASVYDATYLKTLAEDQLFDGWGGFDTSAVQDGGRTPIAGLYVAGPLAGVDSQVLISAGHAASVALALVRDVREAAGLWKSVARHLDWLVWAGVYQGAQWKAQVREYVHNQAGEGTATSRAEADAIADKIIADKQAQQVTGHEVRQRRDRGQRLRSEHLPSEAPAADVFERR